VLSTNLRDRLEVNPAAREREPDNNAVATEAVVTNNMVAFAFARTWAKGSSKSRKQGRHQFPYVVTNAAAVQVIALPARGVPSYSGIRNARARGIGQGCASYQMVSEWFSIGGATNQALVSPVAGHKLRDLSMHGSNSAELLTARA